MLLHVAYFGLLGEEVQQVFDLEHIVFSDDRKRLLHLGVGRLACRGSSSFVPKEVLGDFHPQLLACLATCGLVCVVTRHIRVTDLEGLFDSLRVQVEDTVEYNLGLFDHDHAISCVTHLLIIERFLLLSLQILNLTLTNIDGVIDLEEDRLALLLVSLLTLQVID